MSEPVRTRDDDITSSQPGLERLAASALERARDSGASAAETAVSLATGLDVTVRMGEVETLEHQRDRSLAVTVYFEHRKGTASTADLSEAAVRETVEAACRIARYTADDPCEGLADPQLMAREQPDLDLYHPWALSAEAAIDLARRCETAARDHDTRITNSEGASVATRRAVRVYGNSHGFIGAHRGTTHSVSCAVIGQAEGAMQRDFWYTIARDSADLEPVEAVGRKAAERTVSRLGGRRPGTCRVPVLFVPQTARTLIGHLVAAASGSSLYRRASFLVDRLGEQVCAAGVHLHEQPLLPRALGSTAFDAEGVATAARDLVADGVLQGYVLDSYAARRLGMQTTANAGGVHNLTLEPGEHGFDGLLAKLGRGLVVTELMGQGVNLVTGDYSRGAAGYWVENGRIQHPVEEITVAGNLGDMFRGIAAVGNDLDVRGNIRTPSVLIDEMTVAGE